MFVSMIFRERSRKLYQSILSSLITVRSMGGGPRTFPGGLNKWQWKRLHEKKAREKEQRLLNQEKQLYQARLRSRIRANISGQSVGANSSSLSDHSPMSPEDHIKALADRFIKPGAEDLWNKDDGPIQNPPRQTSDSGQIESIQPPIDLRKLVTDARNLADNEEVNKMTSSMNFGCNLHQKRNYSVSRRSVFKSKLNYRRNSSSSDDDDDYGRVSDSMRGAKWPSFSLDEDESADKDEEGEGRGGKSVRKFMSSAALGKHDIKMNKRLVLQNLEEEEDEEDGLSEQIEVIRREVKRRKMVESLVEKTEEVPIFCEKRFEDCGISPLTVKALVSAGYVRMTRVQETTLDFCLEGKDVLVKERAGTGKTAAFLRQQLPAIEAVIKAMSSEKEQRVPPSYVLILCPTRELASQIAAETRVMLKYHDGIGVQMLVGGTRFKDDQKRLESDLCQILVATPGRLLDHIENRSSLSLRLMGLKMFILDEADHLLDLGFRKDIERIVDCLPRQRQSLLFSATIPKEVRRISQLVLKREHAIVDMVGAGSVETHSKVKQFYLLSPHEVHFQILYHLLKEHISLVPNYKVLVFCTTGMVASLVYQLFREMKLNVREIHSRKPQLYRSRVSDEFKQSNRMILISSDVSARGMNYPDITLVIQLGIPSDREQYIHRVGRTGREGKDGQSILLLATWEEYFLDDLKDLPIERFSLPHIDPNIRPKLEDSMAKIDTSVKDAAYHAWLGYYNSIREIGRDKTSLVEMANKFCESIGLQKPPALFRKTALKMGLRDIPGIRVRK